MICRNCGSIKVKSHYSTLNVTTWLQYTCLDCHYSWPDTRTRAKLPNSKFPNSICPVCGSSNTATSLAGAARRSCRDCTSMWGPNGIIFSGSMPGRSPNPRYTNYTTHYDEFVSSEPTWIRAKKHTEYCITCGDVLKQHSNAVRAAYVAPSKFNSIYFDHYECINPNCPDFAKENTASGFKFSLGVPEVKEVNVRKTHADTIVEFSFVLRPIKGWFVTNAQPIIDVVKGTIPVTHRTYNGDSKKWEIAAEYWPSLELTLKALGWTIRFVKETEIPKVNVPKDYEENFFHDNTPITTKESKDSIHAKLEALLGPNFTKTEYRQYARKHHPDLGGDADKMAEVNRLWAIYNSN